MTNERKEKIGIIMNIMSMPNTGSILKEYCEAEMIVILKELDKTTIDLFSEPE